MGSRVPAASTDPSQAQCAPGVEEAGPEPGQARPCLGRWLAGMGKAPGWTADATLRNLGNARCSEGTVMSEGVPRPLGDGLGALRAPCLPSPQSSSLRDQPCDNTQVQWDPLRAAGPHLFCVWDTPFLVGSSLGWPEVGVWDGGLRPLPVPGTLGSEPAAPGLASVSTSPHPSSPPFLRSRAP